MFITYAWVCRSSCFPLLCEPIDHTHTHTCKNAVARRDRNSAGPLFAHCSFYLMITQQHGWEFCIRLIRFHHLLSGLGIKRLHPTRIYNVISYFIIKFTNHTLYLYCCILCTAGLIGQILLRAYGFKDF